MHQEFSKLSTKFFLISKFKAIFLDLLGNNGRGLETQCNYLTIVNGMLEGSFNIMHCVTNTKQAGKDR